MKPYIFGKRNLIHIIDIKETLKGILLARKFISRTIAEGKDLLIVGTKRQAREAVKEHAERTGMHWVNDRWLGGTLTNFREIRKRIGRLEQLEQLEADGLLDAYSKKEGASLRREMRKILRNLGGIRKMTRLPGAMLVIDQKREIIAVREAIKMGIPVVCLLDTDSNPDVIDIPIPGNDDAMRAIDLVIRTLTDTVDDAAKMRQAMSKDSGDDQAPRRRSKRPSMGQAEDTPAPAEGQQTAEPTPAAPEPETPAEPTPAAPEPPAAPEANPEQA